MCCLHPAYTMACTLAPSRSAQLPFTAQVYLPVYGDTNSSLDPPTTAITQNLTRPQTSPIQTILPLRFPLPR